MGGGRFPNLYVYCSMPLILVLFNYDNHHAILFQNTLWVLIIVQYVDLNITCPLILDPVGVRIVSVEYREIVVESSFLRVLVMNFSVCPSCSAPTTPFNAGLFC